MEKVKILIVDDYTLIRQAWKALFQGSEEYIITAEAKNGAEAVKVCENNTIDLVLMDITMPVMNGIDATKIICSKISSPKVIGLSMHTELEFINKILEAGATGYVSKDVSFAELRKGIATVVNNGFYLGESLRSNLKIINGKLEEKK